MFFQKIFILALISSYANAGNVDNNEGLINSYAISAQQGDVKAQSKLAFLYYKNSNYEKAKKWALIASNNNDSHSQFLLGMMYNHAQGVTLNHEKGVELYQKAADNGSDDAQNIIANFYLYGSEEYGYHKNFTKGISYLKKSAKQDNSDSQYLLYKIYITGDYGQKINEKKALKWQILAAKNGNSDAQNNMGDMYFSGINVPVNYSLAAKWYYKSAIQENNYAIRKLAYLYREGKGVKQSYIYSYMWYKIGGYIVEDIKNKLSSEQIKRADNLVQQCYDTDYKNCCENLLNDEK